ncbi:SDR family NAD(P)-dependent oxidoreductase [Pedobacter miscanthi]|uniref:SDR family NAD(P)-dependent oxidoreductase n=1 Tax=Pedobacter miscanthi TaxID=2259170 RepID=UPI0029300C2A|nr:SDR family oxidoreductase [Pedobacter miscanthi]
MSARNKIALVTGGSRGLGENIALKLAAKGIDVILTYNSREEEAFNVVERIKSTGARAACLQLSNENLTAFPSFFSRLAMILNAEFQAERFEYLINNAGSGGNAAFDATTEEMFDLLMNVLFKGPYFFTQHALGYINDGGVIVNVSSRLAQSSVPGYSAYASMKGAIETLTRYQAKELGTRRIRVNSVAPGPTATDFGGGIVKENVQFRANVTAMTALGRVGEADDIGGVVAFLCTPDAYWITAQRIEVSGGMNI